MKEKILAFLEELMPHIDFTASDDMISDGTLDSISVTTILTALSVEFDFDVSMSEVKLDDFRTIDSITALVEKLMKG